jgi:GH15 family glucan-1,4-alpha-glucosidase
MASPIQDYGIVGDGETCALISRDGSVDFLCWPRFDSDACFCALLGDEQNGFWRIAPEAQLRGIQRRYAPFAYEFTEVAIVGRTGALPSGHAGCGMRWPYHFVCEEPR